MRICHGADLHFPARNPLHKKFDFPLQAELQFVTSRFFRLTQGTEGLQSNLSIWFDLRSATFAIDCKFLLIIELSNLAVPLPHLWTEFDPGNGLAFFIRRIREFESRFLLIG